jgi:hypothetical protein
MFTEMKNNKEKAFEIIGSYNPLDEDQTLSI